MHFDKTITTTDYVNVTYGSLRHCERSVLITHAVNFAPNP
jgi:hypothetical protein